jgi:hypothetical protein
VRRLSLFVATSAALGVLALSLAPGCRDATQVTVEITLAKRATCAETNGTAITVGTDPVSTQQRVFDEFVTATTTSCTEATHQIGTLVVTPGAGRASIIVVVAYDKTTVPSSCKPPLFKGCIVARRQFTFSDHQGLHLPITIDPDCKDVPCDAFSTCRTGKCFSTDVSCTEDSCPEPGALSDGGTNDDAAVVVDGSTTTDGASPPVDGGTDGATDAPLDAPGDGTLIADGPIGLDGPVVGGTGCNAGALSCSGVPCGGQAQACCGLSSIAALCNPGSPTCGIGQFRYCCTTNDCPAGHTCDLLIAGPLPPGPNVPPLPPPAPLVPAGTCSP